MGLSTRSPPRTPPRKRRWQSRAGSHAMEHREPSSVSLPTVRDVLAIATRRLKEAEIPSPPDEARLLLAHELGVNLAWVLAHPETGIEPPRLHRFLSEVDRRSRYEPVAYITGHKEFFGLDLEVNPSVLVPRPETEILVEMALASARALLAQSSRSLTVADLGTGSGAIAIAMAATEQRIRLIAVDRAAEAIALARRNATRHGVQDRIDFRQGDLLEGTDGPLDMLVANLPYIPGGVLHGLMPDVRLYEPIEALDGGSDGTAPTRRAMLQAAQRMARPSALLFEIGDGQGTALAVAARDLYPGASVEVRRDYAGFERILAIEIG